MKTRFVGLGCTYQFILVARFVTCVTQQNSQDIYPNYVNHMYVVNCTLPGVNFFEKLPVSLKSCSKCVLQ